MRWESPFSSRKGRECLSSEVGGMPSAAFSLQRYARALGLGLIACLVCRLAGRCATFLSLPSLGAAEAAQLH